MLGARDSDVQTGQKVIAEGLQSIAFFPQYRLSSYENLILSSLSYATFKRTPGVLPLPAAALLWSPWVDIAYGHEELSVQRNEGANWVPTRVVEWGARLYSGDTPKDDPYLSPARHPFMSGVPTFVAVGTNEILYDSIGKFAKDMYDVKGNRVSLVDMSNAPHDTMFAGIPLGFADEGMEGASQTIRWLEEQRE
ncbi:MAG: hypothetical protein Q9187_003336 [Circinaria calcarea]